MPAHGIARLFRRMRADGLEDRLVLFLDTGKILPRTFRGAFERADALPRNDEPAEKIQELDKAAVLRGGSNCLMKRKILLDRTIAAGDGAAEHAQRLAD